jgi:hypothetical protein
VPESTLLRHEWEIAVALRDITDLRVEHGLNAAASVGPMTNAVLQSQQRALVQAHDAIAARVSELERYADCVSAAETAYRDWQDALRVSNLNDLYLDLVARTAADEHAVAEIGAMTERTSTAQAFGQAVQQLSLAASALETPVVHATSRLVSSVSCDTPRPVSRLPRDPAEMRNLDDLANVRWAGPPARTRDNAGLYQVQAVEELNDLTAGTHPHLNRALPVPDLLHTHRGLGIDLGRGMRNDQVTAGGYSVQEPMHDRVRLIRVEDEVQDP